MKKEILMPADIYIVVNKTILGDLDRKIISMLYQPIIGYIATNLYFSLWSDLDKNEFMSKDFTHHHMMANMQINLADIESAREKLEAVGLLKTYFKNELANSYVYQLYSPMKVYDFFNHPILNIVLYNNLGKKEYDELIKYFSVPSIDIKGFEDITMSFSDVFKSRPMVFKENFFESIKKENKGEIKLNFAYDFDLIVSSLPFIDKEKIFNKTIKDLINDLAFIYDIKELEMANLIGNSIDEKGSINRTVLRKECRNYYQFEEGGKLPSLVYRKQPDFLKKPIGEVSKKAKMIYTFENLTPYEFLKRKYGGAEPTLSDLKLVENLMIDQELNPGVVNVLIDYVLKVNEQKLTKAFVETIAGSWKRLKIETVEEAMENALKEHHRYKNKITKKVHNNKKIETNPEWFDKNIENVEINEEEKKELEELLKEFS